MNNMTVRAENIDKAFEQWIDIVEDNKINEESRDGDVIFECMNACTVIYDPTRCIMKNNLRNMPIRYAIGELLWYLSGNRSLKAIGKFTNAWERMSDDGENVNSNYGYCIRNKYGFDQLEFVMKELTNNPNSRRAVIHIKEASYEESKDVNCTCYLQFFIRDGKLIMHTHMRSNDLWMGFPYDIFQFTCIQIWLSMMLNVELGEYVHIADSLHMYKRDYLSLIKNKKKEEENKNV